MKRHKPTPVMIGFFFLVIGMIAVIFMQIKDRSFSGTIPNEPTIVPSPTPERPEPIKPPSAPLPEPEPVTQQQLYEMYTMETTDPLTELSRIVGPENIAAVLETNRLDLEHIAKDSEIVIPTTFNISNRSPFPLELAEASDITKLLIIHQRIQAFAAYESGKLVRWGPTSTGKQSTKTPNGLFSTNWKGKEVKSSFDDEWILKYNFNVENFEGIGFHQYDMPGYPASHSCVRLLLDDAMWLYEWADQWILNEGGQKRLAHGTPVIITGDYSFEQTAPWKMLPEDPNATTIPDEELSDIIAIHKYTIMMRQEERVALLAVPAE